MINRGAAVCGGLQCGPQCVVVHCVLCIVAHCVVDHCVVAHCVVAQCVVANCVVVHCVWYTMWWPSLAFLPSKVTSCSAPAPLLTEHPCIPVLTLTFFSSQDGWHAWGIALKGTVWWYPIGGFAVLVEGVEKIKEQALGSVQKKNTGLFGSFSQHRDIDNQLDVSKSMFNSS